MALEIISTGNGSLPINAKTKKYKAKQAKQRPPQQQDQFDISDESLGGKIFRNLYKPVASTISTLGGLPGDFFNAMTNVSNDLYGLNNPETANDLGLSKLPGLPDSVTSGGIKQNITNPIGEKLFGVGSQEKQPGMIEDIIDRASQWAPYTIGPAVFGAAKGSSVLPELFKGLGLNLAQGVAGKGAEALNLGELGQFAAEAGTGALGSVLSTALNKKLPEKIAKSTFEKTKLTNTENWNNIKTASKSAPKVSGQPIKNALNKAKETISRSIAGENAKGSIGLIDEILSEMKGSKVSPEKLINARQKINSYYRKSLQSGTSGILGEIKGSIDKSLGESLGEIHQKGLDSTKALIRFKKSAAYKKFVSPEKVKTTDNALQILLKSPLSWIGGAAALKNPALLVGALGAKAYKNIAPVLNNSATRNALLKALGKPAAEQALKSIARSTKINQDNLSSGSNGIDILSMGS